MTPQQRAEIERLARDRKIIEAVRIFREATGASLAESKAAVDAIAAGASTDEVMPAAAAARNTAEIASGLEQVRELLRKRNKIGAIKVYREITGAGLKESKDAVEAMEKEVGPAPVPGKPGVQKQGCFGLLLAMGALLTLVLLR